MPFQKGKPKTGGRKKGSPNKSTLNLEERLRELCFDPVAELIVGLASQPPYQQVETIMKMWEFLYPKRKQVDHDLADNDLKAILIKRLTKNEG